MANIWVLADDRAGNVSQCIGVAEALDMPFEVKQIRYNRLVTLPNILRGASLLGLDKTQSATLEAPWPDLVIAAGRRTAPIARYIKRQSQGKTRLVQIMWPSIPSGDFDLIAVPNHDKKREGSHIFPMTGSPNRITPALLAQAQEQWQQAFSHLPKPLIALIVGGNTKNHVFTPEHAKFLGERASALANHLGGALLVTTSRRTEEKSAQALLEMLTCPYYIYDWRTSEKNPYFGYLACAEAIIVTGDSMSMCSEATATGKPVYIYAPEGATSPKHVRLHQELYNKEWARPLANASSGFSPYLPENSAKQLADEIKHRYFL